MTDNRPLTIALRSAGGAIGIATMAGLAALAGQPLMTIPFASSIVMVLGAPQSPPARARCVIGGHIICAATAVLLTALFGFELWVAALSTGVAMALMLSLDAFHPPAGINPIIVVTAHVSPVFILSPVAMGAVLVAGLAIAFHALASRLNPGSGEKP